MQEDFKLSVFSTSPYSTDLQKQRDAALDSARNIRKVTETPEEYRIRRAQEEQQRLQRLRGENTDELQKRLAELDISNIATRNRVDVEQMIRDAEAIKFFALYNNYDMSAIDFTTLDKAVKAAQLRLQGLKREEEKTDIGSGIFADAYVKARAEKDNILDKMLGGSSTPTIYSHDDLTPGNRNLFI